MWTHNEQGDPSFASRPSASAGPSWEAVLHLAQNPPGGAPRAPGAGTRVRASRGEAAARRAGVSLSPGDLSRPTAGEACPRCSPVKSPALRVHPGYKLYCNVEYLVLHCRLVI